MTSSVDDSIITNAGANAVLEIPQEALLRNDVPAETSIAGLGGATLVDGQVRYTTPATFPGANGSFSYQATDGTETGDPTTVTVTGVTGSTITGTDNGEILVADPTVANPPATVGDINADPFYGLWFSQFGERATGSTIYAAQTFTAPAGGAAAQGLRFALSANDGPSDIEFRVLIVTNDATGVDQFGIPRFSPGQVLFSSVTLTKPAGSGDVVFDVSLGGLSLTPGQTYAFILDPIGVTTSEGFGLTIVRSSGMGYAGGGAYVLSTPTNATAADQPAQFAGDFTPIHNTDVSFQIDFATPAAGATLDGQGGNDTLIGASGNDTLYGGADEDWLYGKDGNDDLEGGAGNDRITAGAGNDRVVYGILDAFDIVDGGSEWSGGIDVLQVRGAVEGLGLDFRIVAASGGTEIDPSATDPDAQNKTDLMLQVRALGDTGAYTDKVRFDEIEGVELTLGANNTITIGNLAGTALLGGEFASPLKITGASGNEMIDVIESGGQHALLFEGGAGSDTVRLAGHWVDYRITTEVRSGQTWYLLHDKLVSNSYPAFVVQTTGVENFYFAGDDTTLAVNKLANVAPTPVADTAGPASAIGADGSGSPTTPEGNVLTNDTDPNVFDRLSVSFVKTGTNPATPYQQVLGTDYKSIDGKYGTLFIKVDGTYYYTANSADLDTQKLKAGQHASDIFTYLMKDNGGLTNTAAITVDVVGANDAPTATHGFVYVYDWGENDGPFQIFDADFAGIFKDVDNDSLAAIRITALPADGTLTFNGVAVAAGDLPLVIPVDDISPGSDPSVGLWFVPANRSSDYSAIFQFQVQDTRGAWSVASNTYRINVDAPSEAPSGADGTIAINEDSSYTFSAADFGFSDPDGNAFAAVKIATLPGQGDLYHDADGGDPANATTVTLGQSIGADAIAAGKLSFRPVANANGLPYVNFKFQVQDDGEDGGNLDQSANTLTINVSPVGDSPTAGDDAANTAAVPLVASLASPAVTLTGPATVLANDTDGDAGEAALLRVTRAGASEAAQIAVADTGETAILGTYGTLYIKADGTYVYRLDNTLASTLGLVGGVQATEQFVYTAANNGGGAGHEDVATLSIVVQGADDPAVTGDTASTPEDTAVTLDVLGNDGNPDGARAVAAIDGTHVSVGGSVTVADGTVTLSADGTLTFTPKDDFNGATAFTYRAVTGLHYQLFDATFTTVANIPTDGGLDGIATDFDVGALAQSLTGSTDSFGVRYTGAINIANGGLYTFFTTSDDGSALYIDGIQVVGNDFSQGPTERSGSTTLAAGTHSVEVRYFETGGGEALAVHVSGPDTADFKAALFDSTLLAPASATVSITVDAVNDAPDLVNLGGTVATNEQVPVLLDFNTAVSDAELDALNGGSGLYTGATLTLARQGGAVAEDSYGFYIVSTLFTVSGSSLKSGGATFATFTIVGGVLTITFDSAETAATAALVGAVLQRITYTNTGDAPPASVVLAYTFNDGSPANGQGSGPAASDTGITTVNITPADDPATASDDGFGTSEDVPVTVDVLANDTDPDSSLSIATINGARVDVGGSVAVIDGTVTLNADGTLTFAPTASFNGTAVFTYGVGTALHYQLFDALFATVADIPATGGLEGFASDFKVTTLAHALTGSTDTFGVRYTGTINIVTGGAYTFFTTSDDGSALYIDGVRIVDNDFSQGATERSGSTTLTAGPHTIEIRYFEGAGGEELAVHVAGPDTAGVKTALFDTAMIVSTSGNATVSITVGAVEDSPMLGGDHALAVAEGGTVTLTTLDLTATDIDTANSALVYTVTSTSHGGVRLNGTGTLTFTQADLAAGRVSFAHDGSEDAGSFAVSLTDGTAAAQTATISVAVDPHVNDLPETEGATVSGTEGDTIAVTLRGSDPDGTVASFRIATPPQNGALFLDAAGTIPVDPDGIAASGGTALIYFVPDLDFSGTTGFEYLAVDAEGGIGDSTALVTIEIAPVADAPVLGGDHALTVEEGRSVTITTSDLTATDPDTGGALLVYTVTGMSNGLVLLDGADATSFTQADLAAGRVSFIHDGNEQAGSFTVSLTDGTAQPQTATITLAVAPFRNDAPTAHDGGASGDEDTVIFGTATATDADNAPSDLTYTLDGTNGGAVRGSVSMNTDGTFTYTPDAEFSGTDRFLFSVTDPDGASSSAEIVVTVNDVKDPPGGGTQGASLLYAENQAAAAIDPALTVTDPDSTDLTGARVAIIAGFASGQDVLGFVNQNGITGSYDAASGVLTLTGTASLAAYQAALRSVTYFNSSDDPSAAARTVNFQVDDGGGLVSLGDTNVTVVPANDGPANITPSSFDVEANTNAVLGGLSIADLDAGAGTLTATLSVGHGTLTVAAAGGVAVAGSGTGTVELTGTLAQINATLAGNVSYRGAQDFFGTDTLTIVTNDGGNSGTGGALTDTDTVTLHVNTRLTGTPGNDGYTALPGNARIDAGGGIDTVMFDFRLVDATVTYQGNKVIIDSASSHTVLTGFERFVFTDGTVDNNDGSALIDDLFYYARYHDVWTAKVDADTHYNMVGWHESRDPNAFFSTLIYLSANPDVKAAGINPLTHFDIVGWQEGRVPSLTFDPAQYLAANPDVAAAKIDPLAHFLAIGASEGRQPFAPSELVTASGFDYVYYLNHNPDVAAAHVDPLWHFQNIGWKEGRNPNALFDTEGYLTTYKDVAAANINPLDHYALSGWHEGRDPSVGFDTSAYLAAYPDVAAANVNPLQHYLAFGVHEGRSPQADGLWG